MDELREVAKFVSGCRFDDLPDSVRRRAALCVLDSVGAALGASDNALMEHVRATYMKLAGTGGTVNVWGKHQKAPLLTAIFLNAMVGHVLELDDVHTNSKTHIGTVVVPAAWCLAQYLGRNGKDFLEAVVCGYEVMARIGMGFGVSNHRNKGWHVTGTAGTFGAAAAAAKLLRLDEEQTLSALGMAGTQSCGLWAFLEDGATCKVLHPARAAASGTEAALLALSGMTGPAHILDAKDGGLFPAMSDKYDLSLVSKGLGEKYEILSMDNKPYPCCRSTHCAIDAALAVRNKYGIGKDDIDSIEVATYLVGYKQCGASDGSKHPKTPVEAKFSTPFTVASVFIFDEVSLKQFRPEAIGNTDVQELLRKVTVIPDERYTSVYPSHWGCELRVVCKDGRKIVEKVTDASGSVDNPLTSEQVVTKATALIRSAFPEDAPRIVGSMLSIADAETLPTF